MNEKEDDMFLRDWFAGQALIAIGTIEVRSVEKADFKMWAENAYKLADAMMRAREGGA